MNQSAVDFEGLGRFLANAGVAPARAEHLVTQVMDLEKLNLTSMLATERQRQCEHQMEVLAEVRILAGRVRREMEAFQLFIFNRQVRQNRMILAVVLAQALIMLAVLCAIMGGWLKV